MATPDEEVAELYQAALAGFHANADWIEPFSALKARLAANFLNKLSILTPQMSQIDEGRVTMAVEEIRLLRREALTAGGSGGRVLAFEAPVRWP